MSKHLYFAYVAGRLFFTVTTVLRSIVKSSYMNLKSKFRKDAVSQGTLHVVSNFRSTSKICTSQTHYVAIPIVATEERISSLVSHLLARTILEQYPFY